MANPRRVVRIPDDLSRALEDKGLRPLWYAGTLQAENGRDIEREDLEPEDVSKKAPARRRKVRRPGPQSD